ncbi:MAG: MmcQ/YjbR family DNA-binding protein, partial [Oscillospiraceae bacterium]|nr:MmcQ/YjbR family DNA-binding protein [Oscillospiraceae bacterium]
GPLLMDVYRKQPGILPGYHMNKDNWLTILLDGSAEDELIKELFELSFDLTKQIRKGRKE